MVECFTREMGCTQIEWLRWLPNAIGRHSYQLTGQSARVDIGAGVLELCWKVDKPRVIGLVRIPRLLVGFRFVQLAARERLAFMARFDLYMQRGGG